MSLSDKTIRTKRPPWSVAFWFRAGKSVPVSGTSVVWPYTTMTERICGANGCRNDADGTAWIGDVKIHTCLECADQKDLTVRLYE